MSVDVLLYVALGEEFRYVMDVLGDGFEDHEAADLTLTYFVGKIPSPVQQRDLSIVVVPAGKMGNTRSATFTSALITEFDPRNVVVLGIAGSLSDDLNPGDIFIPDSVNEYLANAASTGDGKEWTLDTSGNRFTTSPRLLNRFGVFWRTGKTYFDQWQQDMAAHSDALITPKIRAALAAENLSLPDNRLLAGDDRNLASGPAVGKGTAFGQWVRKRIDRKIAAMEMESAGVHDATLIRARPPRAIAIRAISDFADERKEKIEKIAGNRVRILATKNAVSLFVAAVRAGLFREEQETAVPVPPQVETAPTKLFAIKLVQIRDQLGKLIGESLEHGQLEAETLAQQILNARNVGTKPSFSVQYAEAGAILAEKERLEKAGNPDLLQQRDIADFEHRLRTLDYKSSMVLRRLEILFHPKLTRQIQDSGPQYAQRILGLLELMWTRSASTDPSRDVAVWHSGTQRRMAGPIGNAIATNEGFERYLARGGGSGDFLVNVYPELRDRRCFPLMIDLISQTNFVPPTDSEFGHYGPLPDDDALFDLDNWRITLE
ncbi:hypothetical protein [Bradyrhizobium prioriisuperbiae]|uniref:5'-methylthioadenosine/S-adenosylhomocysteine nucleosidase family protein n=1 Tax=Bradyrhizobium prioriisuperbiae TaxID=2854389 RepID=UPI0028ED0E08|nr:hypothetical protein [Bradyrhizobium prioritasuperba]